MMTNDATTEMRTLLEDWEAQLPAETARQLAARRAIALTHTSWYKLPQFWVKAGVACMLLIGLTIPFSWMHDNTAATHSTTHTGLLLEDPDFFLWLSQTGKLDGSS